MKLIDMFKRIRNKAHHDMVWRDYLGVSIVRDSQNTNLIKDYIQNEFLLSNIGLGEIKKLPQYQYFQSIHNLTKIHCIDDPDRKMKRVGKDDDGGYVMMTPFSEKKIAYSLGINTDVSWDNMMADNGYDVYMYDHTINRLPHKRDKFHWQKVGVTGGKETSQLKKLSTLIDANGHKDVEGMVLKMDIEGAEWETIEDLDIKYLGKFDQIIMEIHGLLNVEKREVINSVLGKIFEVFCCVHIHANNFSRVEYFGDLILADVMEATWVNRRIKMSVKETILPTQLDRPCDSSKSDIILGKW